MALTVLLAEKKTAAEDVAAWMGRHFKLSVVKVGGSHFQVGDYAVTWLYGHVLENLEPHDYDMKYKKWDMAHLPFVPEKWLLRPKMDKKTGEPNSLAASRIAAAKALLAKATEVIGLGDPDDEGQLLQDEFLIWAGWRGPTRRLWLNATDDATVAKCWADMKPNEAYAGNYWAALARSHADFLAGINGSRACTLSAQVHGNDALLTWGRVQTPTLALVVRREQEIRHFKPVNFFSPHLKLATEPTFKAIWQAKSEDERLDLEGRMLKESDAKAIAAAATADGCAVVVSLSKKAGKEQAPLLFSLSSLQALMSKKYGISAPVTLELAQALYLKKISSYPRSDAEYLKDSQHSESPEILDAIMGGGIAALGSAPAKADRTIKSRAFNSKELAESSHHAIVPRPFVPGQLASLSANEMKLFTEICKRYLLQFFPAAEFSTTEALLSSGGETYRTRGKVYASQGWRDAFALEDDEDDGGEDKAVLPAMAKGDRLPLAAAGYDAKETKAPKRYTSGSLLTAMKNIHHFVLDEKFKATLRSNTGIGTEATRANILVELINKKYLEALPKDVLKPSVLGEQLIDALPVQMTAPDLSAMWQQAMDDIKKTKKAGYDDFLTKQRAWLNELIRDVPGWFVGKTFKSTKAAGGGTPGAGATTKPTKHTCLKCKGELLHIKGKYGWFFSCQAEGCKESFKDVAGKPQLKVAPVAGVKIGEHASGDACPKCGKGTLALRTCGPKSSKPGVQFLACTQFYAKGADQCNHSVWPK